MGTVPKSERERPQGDAAASQDSRSCSRRARCATFRPKTSTRRSSAEGIDVGLATVYRVLTQFEQAGLLSRQNFEHRQGGVRAEPGRAPRPPRLPAVRPRRGVLRRRTSSGARPRSRASAASSSTAIRSRCTPTAPRKTAPTGARCLTADRKSRRAHRRGGAGPERDRPASSTPRWPSCASSRRRCGFEVVGTFTQKRAGFDKAAYFGTGKREELSAAAGTARRRRDPHRPRDLPLAGVQPGEGGRRRGDGPHHGHPRDLSPARELAHRARAGRDRAPRLHGAAPARSRQAGRAEGPGAQRHRRPQRRRSRTASSTGARSATAWPSCRRSSTRWPSGARRSAPGGRSARGSRAWRSVGYTNAGKSTLMRALTGKRGAGRRQALRDARYHGARPASRDRPARARQRHGRLHQEPAARPGRVVQVDARRSARGVAARPRRRRERSRVRAAARGDRGSARRDRREGRAAPARLQQDRPRRGRGGAAREVPGLHRDERAAARAMSRSCTRRSPRSSSGDLVEAELFLPWSAQKLRGEIFATCTVLGGARRRRGRVPARARRARGRRSACTSNLADRASISSF